MCDAYSDIIARHSTPLDPLPAGHAPDLRPLSRLRAVLFDVYGTMMVSASGDIGTAAGMDKSQAVAESLQAVGIRQEGLGSVGAAFLEGAIRAEHQKKLERGCAYPEVDIVCIWQDFLEYLSDRLEVAEAVQIDAKRLAVEYEVRTNPVWPMPGLVDCLSDLARSGLIMGIISNAQFYTPLLFPALLEKSLIDLAFDPDVQYYSYQSGEAKPGETMYRQAAETLGRRGIAAREILYVGNDLLNDIMPASRLGFQTALFAGDRRSLRLRAGDDRVAGVRPDIVVTDLAMLAECVSSPFAPRK